MNLRQRMASTSMCSSEEGEPTLTVLDFGHSSSSPTARDPSREQQGPLPPCRPDCRHALVPCTFRIQVSRLSQDTSFPVSSCLWQVYGYPFLGALPPFYNSTPRRRIKGCHKRANSGVASVSGSLSRHVNLPFGAAVAHKLLLKQALVSAHHALQSAILVFGTTVHVSRLGA